MYTINTSQNLALAGAVNSRIKADAMMLKAKSAGIHLASVGAMCALISLGAGLGVGAGFFGYSYISDTRTSAQQIAQALSSALENSILRGEVKLNTNGALVQVDPTGTVRLNTSGAIVQLDPKATVKLDPNAVVNVRGNVVASEATTPRFPKDPTSPDPRVVTGYTIFKTVEYGKGEVHTGWEFSSSEETSPHNEFCYYSENVRDGIDTTFQLATNGQLDPLKGKLPKSFNQVNAAKNCVWFNGGSTRSG
jgi:hypothetical protein